MKYGITTNHVLGFEMILSDGEKYGRERLWMGARMTKVLTCAALPLAAKECLV
ncbi:MAG TPA: hypothetical protein DCR61_07805 [Verrucomicrobiales bacterium]|nr:hypothetical protein [Verrucomicrobiales bacterium]